MVFDRRHIILNYPQVIVLADLIAVLCLLEVRKLEEAESRLNRTLSFPDEVITPYGLRGRERFRAFIHISKKEFAQADECLKRYIEYSHELGQPPVKSPWLFELLDALEKHGFEHEEISYDGELERMLKGNDIHMKGAAYRYRALRNLERHVTSDSVIDDLKQSEKYLKKAGAEIELARVRVDLARIYLQKKDFQRARSCLTSAWAVFSKVDKRLFPKDLLPFMPQEYKTEFMIDRMIAINCTLGTANELSSFLEQAINLAIDLSMATRGAFFKVEDNNKPIFKASRNLYVLSHE
jgi:tetratricopeptide (TPR) repeat protein